MVETYKQWEERMDRLPSSKWTPYVSGGKTTTKRKPKPKLKRKPKSKRNNPEMYPPTKKKKTNKVLKQMGLKKEDHWRKMFGKKNKGKNG